MEKGPRERMRKDWWLKIREKDGKDGEEDPGK